MIDLIGWIVAPLALTMIVERADKLGRWLIERAADAFDEDSFREEWLADLEAVDGQLWKLWYGFGIYLRCLPALAVKRRSDARAANIHVEMRRLRRKFSPDAWWSLLNAAEFEADAYNWVKPEYRIDFMERFIVEHGLGVRKAQAELKRLDRRERRHMRRSRRSRRRL
jgi:hypothetical protein